MGEKVSISVEPKCSNSREHGKYRQIRRVDPRHPFPEKAAGTFRQRIELIRSYERAVDEIARQHEKHGYARVSDSRQPRNNREIAGCERAHVMDENGQHCHCAQARQRLVSFTRTEHLTSLDEPDRGHGVCRLDMSAANRSR